MKFKYVALLLIVLTAVVASEPYRRVHVGAQAVAGVTPAFVSVDFGRPGLTVD